MSKQVIIGLCTEGTTDMRFYESIVERTFRQIANECRGQIDILPIIFLTKQKGSFIDAVQAYCHAAATKSIMVLCIHTDADSKSDKNCFTNKINPAFEKIANSDAKDICNNLVAIVPIYMTEAWMLADKNLLKANMNTSKTNKELGIHRSPETIAKPKQVIKDAITEARKNLRKRSRRDLTIADL